MAAQEEITQVLDLGTAGGPKAEAPAPVVSATDTNPFNTSAGTSTGAVSGFQPIATGFVTRDGYAVSGSTTKSHSPRTIVLIGLGVVFAAVAALMVLTPTLVDDLLAMIGLGETPALTPTPAPKKQVAANPEPQTVPEQEAPKPANQPKNEKPDSVWSVVENEMGSDLAELGPALTTDQDAMLREKLSHNFNYQRYLGVIELSALRASGSEDLLRSALESKKFWIRMRALIGLADLGVDIEEDDVKMALGDAHSELRARFFKRFEKSPCSPGCFYVARAVLPFMDPLGRAQAIRVISREKSDVRDLFLVAATFDKSDVVKAAAEDWLSRNSVDDSVRDDVKAAMSH